MANKIKPKRSYTSNSVPLTTDLETNELAINWADGKAYTKNASGQIVSVTLGGSGGSSSSEDTALRAYFVPTAPTNVTATAGNGQASVTWTASTTIAQIPVTDYVVQYSSNSGSTWTTFSDGTSTSTSATVTGLTNGTAYTFRVAGVNGVGTGAYSTASSAVTPTAPVPVITIAEQPANQTASGGSATFSVAATVTQSATLSYQWQKQESGTGSFTNISGATSSSLALSNLTNADDNGDVYRVVVSATGGAQSVTSSSVTLTVPQSAPSSVSVSGYTNGSYGPEQGVSSDKTLNLSGTSNGRPAYYVSLFTGNGYSDFSIGWSGSAWVYKFFGDTLATNSNDTPYPPNIGWSFANMVVTGGSTLPAPVISITSQPTSQTASGGSATFSVTAQVTPNAALSYQWQKQEGGTGSFTNISGATSSSLALSNLTNADDNGDVYRCVVSATGGAESVTSSSATLTVAAATSGWNISSASYARSFSVAAQETNPTSLAFSGDGTKMYVLGSAGDDVNQYALSSAWDISTATYVQNKVVDDTTPLGVSFAPDGTRMYVAGNFNEAILQYALSTPWDIATASYTSQRGLGQSRGVFFKSDGTSCYTAKTGVVEEYSLSVPWDITSETYLRAFSTPQDTSMQDLFFKPDGTAMYLIGATNDKVYEYALSSPWNVSTATYVRDFGFSVQEPSPTGVYFKGDGTRMYIVGTTSDSVHEYSL